MFKTFKVKLHQHAFVLADGVPLRVLGPGSHLVWGFGLTAQIVDTRELVFSVPSELRALLPSDELGRADIGPLERGVLFREGRPVAFLRPGVTTYWTVDDSVQLHVFDVREPLVGLYDELRAIVPKAEIVESTVYEYQRGLLYVSGRFERALGPGRYAMWTHPEAPVHIRLIDMRRKQLTIGGQELLTRDKVTLRLSLTVDFAPLDPETGAHTVVDPDTALYGLVQLAIREYVASVTLDELLEGRDAMTRFLEARTENDARRLGLKIEAIGVKDIVLPGDMKQLLNRVIEAEKQSLANAIHRKEEAAATRTMANSAKVVADNPVLLRMKELEAYERIASNIGEVRVIAGADGIRELVKSIDRA